MILVDSSKTFLHITFQLSIEKWDNQNCSSTFIAILTIVHFFLHLLPHKVCMCNCVCPLPTHMMGPGCTCDALPPVLPPPSCKSRPLASDWLRPRPGNFTSELSPQELRVSHDSGSGAGPRLWLRSAQATEKDSCLSLTVVRETERELRSLLDKETSCSSNEPTVIKCFRSLGRCEVSGA